MTYSAEKTMPGGAYDSGAYVCSELGHVDEITSGSMREFHRINTPVRADDIRNMRDCCAGSPAKIEHLGPGGHVNVVDTTENGGGQLGTEGVPNAVLDFGPWAAVLKRLTVNRYALFAVHISTGR